MLNDVDFIKIDTQGYEYEVLLGASKIIDNVLAVIAECWSVPIHKVQYLTHDITKLMYDQQFEILSLQNGTLRRHSPEKKYPGGGTSPVWQEVLFFNTKYSSLSKEKQKKLVIILMIYGHFGFAAHLAKTLLNLSLDGLLESYINKCKPFDPYFPRLHY